MIFAECALSLIDRTEANLKRIEKVRGSTPLISTTPYCVQIQGFPRFLFARTPARIGV